MRSIKSFNFIILLTIAIQISLPLSAYDIKTIEIIGVNFTRPLIEKWIEKYSEINPGVKIVFVDKLSVNNNNHLRIIADKHNINPDGSPIVFAAKYALLPVTNSKNPLLPEIGRRGINKRELDGILFEVFNFDDDEIIRKPKYRFNVYSRENQAITPVVLANHFGYRPSEIRGRKVFGDDVFLTKAIESDSLGLTFNTLTNIFDINTRLLKNGITLLPLDFKREERKILSGNLDDVISVLENFKIETVPVTNIGFELSSENNIEVNDFLRWILNDGQQFVNEKGFLKIEQKLIVEQSSRLHSNLLSSNF